MKCIMHSLRWSNWGIRLNAHPALLVNKTCSLPPNRVITGGKSKRERTYVKSWRMTRAGLNGTSTLWVWVSCQFRMFSTSKLFTKNSSQFLMADSNRTRMENGSLSEEQINSGNKHSGHLMIRIGFSKIHFVFTVSGISKFKKIEKPLAWYLGAKRLHYMLERIVSCSKHPLLCECR